MRYVYVLHDNAFGKVYRVLFRIIGSDVFEMDVIASTYHQAQMRALEYWGLSMDSVTFCDHRQWSMISFNDDDYPSWIGNHQC
jgi:hypothetical protein